LGRKADIRKVWKMGKKKPAEAGSWYDAGCLMQP
jgi:hypothetical protein